MKSINALTRMEIEALLNKCRISHDGMWFFYCVRDLGIEKANELNRAAAHIEMARNLDALRTSKKGSFIVPPLQRFFQRGIESV